MFMSPGTVVHHEIHSITDIILFSSISIGGLLASLVSIILLIHIIYNYMKIFHDNNTHQTPKCNNKYRNKLVYFLLILNLFFTLISSIIYTFIRSSLFTQITPNQFSSIQCVIGYIVSWTSTLFAKFFMYLLFLYRIKLVFEDSTFKYNDKIYLVLFIMFIIQFIVTLSIIFMDEILYKIEWELSYYKPWNMSFCARNDDNGKYASILGIGIEIINCSILLFLFIKGLYSLHISLMKHITSDNTNIEINRLDSMSTVSTTSIVSTQNFNDKELEDIDEEKALPKTRKLSMNDLMRIKRESGNISIDSINVVIKLHDLMKKQTILVCIAIISSISIYISASIEQNLSMEISWDLMINSLCLCLMCGCSKKYWNWCTKYGVCCCCYYKEQQFDDI